VKLAAEARSIRKYVEANSTRKNGMIIPSASAAHSAGEREGAPLIASHEAARPVRDRLADAAVAADGNARATMSVTSPLGRVIRTSSPFRRVTALAVVG
jgi:hypothetical protein